MSNRHTFVRLSFSAIIAIMGLSISMLTYAESGEILHDASGMGTITIEQKNGSENKVYGTWTLVRQNSEPLTDDSETYTLQDVAAGSYTLFIEPPEGVATSVRSYHGNEVLQYVQRPQLTFRLTNGENLRIAINYTLTRTGMVSVQSDPPGMIFELTGPNDIKEEGVTPMSYPDLPVGQYKVQYTAIDGCNTPAPQSQQLVLNGRASFNITVDCKNAEKLRVREETKNEAFVEIAVDKEMIILRDVPQEAWFSKYVFNAARYKVLGGYKDEAGRPNGLFGPSNNVTVAELAKIAHGLGGVSSEAFIGKSPENAGALGVWFSPYIASAEAHGWTVYQDTTIDPLRPATRAEVVQTFLQVLEIPLKWQKGQLFSDVSLRTRYAAAIETAAADKIIDGRMDEGGKPLNLFAPEDPINRAEIAKIINEVFEVYLGEKADEED